MKNKVTQSRLGNKVNQQKLDQKFLNLFSEHSLKKYTSKEISNKARILLTQGANIDATGVPGYARFGAYGYTALDEVVHCEDPVKRLALVKMLIANGANVNVVDIDGRSPIYYGARHLDKKLIGILLEAGADINQVNNYGNTVLSAVADILRRLYAYYEEPVENYTDKEKLLLEVILRSFGQKIYKKNLKKQLLHLINKCRVLITYLLEHGADPKIDIESVLTNSGRKSKLALEGFSYWDFLTYVDKFEEVREVYEKWQKKQKIKKKVE